jgi:hypothetical protein
MDDLVKMVADRSGIPQEKAQSAVNTVVGYLKDHLPTPLSTQIDQAIGTSGSSPSGSQGFGSRNK